MRNKRLIAAAALVLLPAAILTGIYFAQHNSSDTDPAETSISTETGTDSISITETTTAQVQATTSVMTGTSTPETTTETTTTETTTTETTTTETEITTTETTTTTEAIGVESITLTFYEVQLYIGESKMPIVTMHPENSTDKSEIWSTSDEFVASVNGYGKITAKAVGNCVITIVSADNPEVSAEVKVTVLEPPVTEPLATEPPETAPPATEPPAASGPTYIGGILIANKTYSLPKDYNPGLDPTCKSQFDKLTKAAAAEGLNIYLSSGFRSYDYQKRIYNNYVGIHGQAKADTFSARPGHSEHQTGLAIDVNTVTDSFANTAEAAWLAAHAHEFGFIIRYPKGKEHITGYKYEPWHIRYLGVDTASKVYNSGLTLEEYLGITSCYSY